MSNQFQDIVNTKIDLLYSKIAQLDSTQTNLTNINDKEISKKMNMLYQNDSSVGYEIYRNILYYSKLYLDRSNINYNTFDSSLLLKELRTDDNGTSVHIGTLDGFYPKQNLSNPDVFGIFKMVQNTVGTDGIKINWDNINLPSNSICYTGTSYVPQSYDPAGITSSYNDLKVSVLNRLSNLETEIDSYLQSLYFTINSVSYTYNPTFTGDPVLQLSTYTNVQKDYDITIYSINTGGDLVSINIINGGTGFPTNGKLRLKEVTAGITQIITNGWIVVDNGVITEMIINTPHSGWVEGTAQITQLKILDGNGHWVNWTQSGKTLNTIVNTGLNDLIQYNNTYKNNFLIPLINIYDKVGTDKIVKIINPQTYKSNFETLDNELDTLTQNLNNMIINLDDTTKNPILEIYGSDGTAGTGFRTFLNSILTTTGNSGLYFDYITAFNTIFNSTVSNTLTSTFWGAWKFWIKELIDKNSTQNIGSIYMFLKISETIATTKNDIVSIKNTIDYISTQSLLDHSYYLKPVTLYPVLPNPLGVLIKWTPSNFITTYEIQRSLTDKNHYITIGTVDMDTSGNIQTEFIDDNVISGNTYYYRVKGYSNGITYFGQFTYWINNGIDMYISLNELLGQGTGYILDSNYSDDTNSFIVAL